MFYNQVFYLIPSMTELKFDYCICSRIFQFYLQGSFQIAV